MSLSVAQSAACTEYGKKCKMAAPDWVVLKFLLLKYSDEDTSGIREMFLRWIGPIFTCHRTAFKKAVEFGFGDTQRKNYRYIL